MENWVGTSHRRCGVQNENLGFPTFRLFTDLMLLVLVLNSGYSERGASFLFVGATSMRTHDSGIGTVPTLSPPAGSTSAFEASAGPGAGRGRVHHQVPISTERAQVYKRS